MKFATGLKQRNDLFKLADNQHLKIMCEKCFKKEILRFESESEYVAFEKCLNQKANFVKLINAKDDYLNDFYYTYTCKICNQNWWLSTPDNA